MINQKEIVLNRKERGVYLITEEILSQIGGLPKEGLMHLLIKHTSAAITLNENADPSVRHDFDNFLDEMIPEHHPVYTHTYEGADDMPAHLKASIIGQELTIPITNGRLNLGTWQGIYFLEFRDMPTNRKVVITVMS
jgi:secondary thiamine-phosphate synthase enzyme